MEEECRREQGRLFIFLFCCMAIQIRDSRYLKENPSEDASWSEKVAQVQRLPSAMVTILCVKNRCWKVTTRECCHYISDVINKGRLFIFLFCCMAIQIRDSRYLKENPSEDASWSEKVAQVKRLPSAMVTILCVKNRCCVQP